MRQSGVSGNHPQNLDGVRAGGKVDRLFSFRCGTSGAQVTCLRCGAVVARGRWPRDVYPKSDTHVCEES
jgi:hypothetical protein